ncbi:hypothetical protein AMECASPLE_018852 [Ameca splendens]|uniref:Uncharacterized protein n=1 Tax=Ameca splendens TaxID=208324 RepID=A0ABV0YQF9_9TELE
MFPSCLVKIYSICLCSHHTPAFPSFPLHCLTSTPSPPCFPQGPSVNFDLHKELVKCLCNPCVCVCGCVSIHCFFFFHFLQGQCPFTLSVTQETSCLGPSDQGD